MAAVVVAGWFRVEPIDSVAPNGAGDVGAQVDSQFAGLTNTSPAQSLQPLDAAQPAASQPQVSEQRPEVAAVASTPQLPPLTREWDPAAPGIVSDPVLVSHLDQALAGVDGHVGVAVKDLGSGRGAVLNGDLELQSASLYKLPVMFTVFDLGLSMNEELPITSEALSYDSGTMELGPGEMLSVAEALERMITLSDNTSAIMLGTRVGATHIDTSIAALGMDTTHYSLERMTSSALDMERFVETVADGDAVSTAASADMLHLMLRQRVNDRIPRLLPDDVQVAHKTGNLPGVVNDVGVMYGPTSTVAVAAMISDTSDETAAATAIAQVALESYTYFADQPEEPNRPQIPPPPNRPIPPVWREPAPPPAIAPAKLTEVPTLEPTQAPTVSPTPPPRPAAVLSTPVPTAVRAQVIVAPTAVPPTAVPATPVPPTPVPPTPTTPPPPPTSTPVPPPTTVAHPTSPPARNATPTVKAR